MGSCRSFKVSKVVWCTCLALSNKVLMLIFRHFWLLFSKIGQTFIQFLAYTPSLLKERLVRDFLNSLAGNRLGTYAANSDKHTSLVQE